MRGVVALALATSPAVAGACGASTTAEKASAAKGTNQKVGVEVTDKTKMIANGIEARVVRDTVTENGRRSRSPATGTPRTRPGRSGTSASGEVDLGVAL